MLNVTWRLHPWAFNNNPKCRLNRKNTYLYSIREIIDSFLKLIKSLWFLDFIVCLDDGFQHFSDTGKRPCGEHVQAILHEHIPRVLLDIENSATWCRYYSHNKSEIKAFPGILFNIKRSFIVQEVIDIFLLNWSCLTFISGLTAGGKTEIWSDPASGLISV